MNRGVSSGSDFAEPSMCTSGEPDFAYKWYAAGAQSMQNECGAKTL
jgi:hypothetical protein